VIWWNGTGSPGPEGRFNLAYTLRATTYNGLREAQLQWVDFQPMEESVMTLQPPSRQIVDCREVDHPLAHIRQILSQGEATVWCEGEAKSLLARSGIMGQYRHELSACENLIIWSTPPGRPELRAALKLVDPKTVTIYGIDPEFTMIETFLKRLAGLVKFALNRQSGRVSLPALASATGQREVAIRRGLDWLQAKGHIQWEELVQGEALIKPGTGFEVEDHNLISSELQLLLDETGAFRLYFKKVATQDLRIIIQ
jgi:single-stranded-DNA-specific exonuclease